MPRLTIDGREVEAPEGATVLEAAARLGVEIPTLCHGSGLPHHTSCMVCLVRNRVTGAFLPACSHPALEGMDIETAGEDVRQARRGSLALLLSEHVGDCEAPCRRICPAGMDIPFLLRLASAGRWDEAYAIARRDLVMPGVLGRVCPAPCEKGCRRGAHDAPVAIAAMHHAAARRALASGPSAPPVLPPLNGRRVTVVGAGPAGLSAAWFLRRSGFACSVIEAREAAGGALRHAISDERLPRALLDAEIAVLAIPDVEFRFGQRIDDARALLELRRAADAVVLALGSVSDPMLAALELPRGPRGVQADSDTLQTPAEGVFVAGAMVHGTRMAVRAVADGRAVARSVQQWISGIPLRRPARRFNSRIGRLKEGEMAVFLGQADPRGRLADPRAAEVEALEGEARRCLGCDCRKAHTCRLRRYADEYEANASEFRAADRRAVEFVTDHPDLVYEPGKCIKCGLCIRITSQARVPVGMAFHSRGYDVRVAPSFDDGMAAALGGVAAACVEACPTAALSWRAWDSEGESGE